MKQIYYSISAILIFSISVFAQDGSYDATFGTNGTTTTDIPGDNEISVLVAENADGSLWAHAIASLNTTSTKILVRYSAAGVFDTSFGVDGVVSLPLNGSYTSLKALPDGSMLIGGVFNEDFVVLKYTINGVLDTTFGNNGIATIDFETDLVLSLFVNEDNTALIIGRYRTTNEDGISISKLLADGTIDPTYGSNGVANSTITTEDEFYTFQISRFSNGGFLVPFRLVDVNENSRIGFAKISENGSLDPSFGNNGVAVNQIALQSPFSVSAVIQESQGILGLINNRGLNPPIDSESFFIQLLPNGSLDTGFGNKGVREISHNTFSPLKVIRQENDRTLFIGREWSIDGGNYTILRSYTDGFIDPSFANQGRFIEPNLDAGEAIITEDGGIVGCAFTPIFNGPQNIVLFKLLNSPLGVEEENSKKILIAPNPTNDLISITCTNCDLIGSVFRIFDATGREVQTGIFELDNPLISVESLAAGLYYLSIEATRIKFLKK